MPAMGPPYRGWPDTTPGRDPLTHSLRARLRTTVHRDQLTRALAEGADPNASGELALRARQLTSQRNRKVLARSLRGAIVEAHQPTMSRMRTSIIDRRAVLDAEASITEMIERLGGTSPMQPQGIALLVRILTNADGASPLYNASEPGTLRRTIRTASAAFDAQTARSHEFALAA